MTDNLVERLDARARKNIAATPFNLLINAKERIEALTAQLESTLRDRKAILEERDRTFALMLARAEKAEAERDRLREALTEWDALIEHQYSGSREAMSAMTSVAQRTAKLLKGETP